MTEEDIKAAETTAWEQYWYEFIDHHEENLQPPSRQHFYRAFIMGWHGGAMSLGDDLVRYRDVLTKIALGDPCSDYLAAKALKKEIP